MLARLPTGVPAPAALGVGDDGEFEWSLLARVEGVPLSDAWPQLDPAAREGAIRQLAAGLRALHATRGADLPTDADLEPPHALGISAVRGLVDRVARAARVTPDLAARTIEFLDAWPPGDDPEADPARFGLAHGDIHLENLLFDPPSRRLRFLDFEWSRRSWPEVDLEILLAFFDHPQVFVSAAAEARTRPVDYAGARGWLLDEYPALVAGPRVRDRLSLLALSRAYGLLAEFAPAGPERPGDPRDRRGTIRALLGPGRPRYLRLLGD